MNLLVFLLIFAFVMTNDTHRIILCLASNTCQQHYLERARQALATLLPGLSYTTEHWTQPVGAVRDDLYLNQLAAGETHLPLNDLQPLLKQIEQQLDREHDGSGIVTIDIDLLQYDETRYHLRDWQRDYVRLLLPELP